MQYSLFTDGAAQRANTLMIREPDGAMRQANRAEILSVARELVSVDEIRGQALSSPAVVKDFPRLRLTGLGHEVCGVLLLDSRNQLIVYLEPFRGTLGQAAVYPREILKLALAHNTAAVILAHNHPSGNSEPSRSDEELTRTMRSGLSLVDIRLLDHLIVAGSEVDSMAEHGLL